MENNEANIISIKSIKDKWIRTIGIPFVGIVMPLIFYTSSVLGLIGWVLISLSLTFITWEGSRRIVKFLWIKYPWERKPIKHLFTIVLFSFSLIILLGLTIYFINYFVNDVSPEYWEKMKGVHMSIILLTFFTTSVYEGILLFSKWKRSLLLSAMLEKENMQSQFEGLKSQINPHFLFNSLSALSSIIPKSPEKAVEFVNKFSEIYRYILDIKDKTLVELKDELNFVKSYVFLQKIRFGENLQVKIAIDKTKLKNLIMPLSFQVLIENAIKHNEISDRYPLKILLTHNEKSFIVKNNLQQIINTNNSTKIGLKNLTERYELMSNVLPRFYIKGKEFIAEIPFLEYEYMS